MNLLTPNPSFLMQHPTKLLLLSCMMLSITALYGQQSHNGYFFNGSASPTGNCFQLTAAQNSQAGSVWYGTLVDLSQPFEIYLDIYFGSKNFNGADGMAFVLQNQNTSLGGVGGGMGYRGINTSLAIEFDTYQNGNTNDPSFDHMAIQQNGDLNHNGVNNLAGPVQISASSTNVEDNQFHDLRISWDPITQSLEVSVDCQVRLSYIGNIVQDIFSGNPFVFWGFTAATGALNNRHEFCLDYISFTEKLNNTAICLQDTVTLDPGTGAQYLWSPAIGLSSTSVRAPLAFPDSTTTYRVQITDECGLARTDSITLVVDPPVQLSLGPDTTTCEGDSVLLIPQQQFGTAFLWSTGDTTPTLLVKQPGSYSLVVSNPSCGPGDEDTLTLSWVAPPQINLPPDDTICEGESLQISAMHPDGIGYMWSTGDTTPHVTLSQAGSYEVRVISEYCDAQTDDFVLSLSAPISFSLGADQTICEIDDLTLSAAHPQAIGYLWNTGDTTSLLTTHIPGTYIATLAHRFCPTVSDTIEVITRALLKPTLAPDTLVCESQPLMIDATTAGADGYIWGDGLDLAARPIESPGLYTVRILDNGPCPDVQDSIEVRIAFEVAFEFPADTLIVCPAESPRLEAFHPFATTYQWNTGETSLSIIPQQEGLYEVSLANEPCPNVSDEIYVLFSNPVADFELSPDPTQEQVIAAEEILFSQTATDAGTFFWTFSELGLTAAGESALVAFPEDGTYQVSLVVTDRFGKCQDSTVQSIEIGFASIPIPNAFTPNGDGTNDVWRIQGFGVATAQVSIFNRWGKQVYLSQQLDQGWDGRDLNNHMQAEGVYVYVVEGNLRSGRPFRRTGSITLLR